MTKQPTSDNISSPDSSLGLNLDIKRLIADVLHFWWLFALFISLSLGVVFVIHRYSVPVYSTTMALLMEERGTDRPQSDMMEGFGLTPGQSGIDNQIAILSSWEIISKTIERLDFRVSYYAKGNLKNTELYHVSPFVIQFDTLSSQLINTPIYFTFLENDKFELKVETENGQTYNYFTGQQASIGKINFSKVFSLGEDVQTPWGSFKVANVRGNPQTKIQYYFKFNHPNALTGHYKSLLRVNVQNNDASIVRVSMTGKIPYKNKRFLDALAEVFIENNLEKKNLIATNTIKFIEEQLTVISDTLYTTGNQLSRFRTENRIQSISAKAEYLFKGLQDIEQELAELQIVKRYYLYLNEYFSKPLDGNRVLAPAVYQTEDNMMADMIKKIIDLNSQRIGTRQSYGEDLNPAIREIENELSVVTNTLLSTISSQLKVINESIKENLERKVQKEHELYTLPEQERRLLGIERKFDLSNEVYTFLLRKRSEAQIQKASNTPDHQLLEAARFSGQISPNKSEDRKNAILIGLLIPLAFIVLRNLLNNKILSPDDLEKITNLPVLGHVIHSPKEESNVIQYHPRSVVTETFRRVRTRLEFFTQDKVCPVIGITSSMPGEGKTFCALNIAAALAISGKKTALLGFDLRKPGLNKIINSNGHIGISNYLIGKANVNEIIMEVEQENLFVIPTGDIPPNPSELISSPKMESLISQLKKQFDVIVLDTPPMGIVSDPYLLARHTDVLVFLVRQNHTIKSILRHTLKNVQDEGIEHISLLLNDVVVQRKRYGYAYGYGYDYGYGYGYNSGYYEE